MKPYSQALRERVVHALGAQEESHVELAERFAVSLSLVDQLGRWRTMGS
jgi:transposase